MIFVMSAILSSFINIPAAVVNWPSTGVISSLLLRFRQVLHRIHKIKQFASHKRVYICIYENVHEDYIHL